MSSPETPVNLSDLTKEALSELKNAIKGVCVERRPGMKYWDVGSQKSVFHIPPRIYSEPVLEFLKLVKEKAQGKEGALKHFEFELNDQGYISLHINQSIETDQLSLTYVEGLIDSIADKLFEMITMSPLASSKGWFKTHDKNAKTIYVLTDKGIKADSEESRLLKILFGMLKPFATEDRKHCRLTEKEGVTRLEIDEPLIDKALQRINLGKRSIDFQIEKIEEDSPFLKFSQAVRNLFEASRNYNIYCPKTLGSGTPTPDTGTLLNIQALLELDKNKLPPYPANIGFITTSFNAIKLQKGQICSDAALPRYIRDFEPAKDWKWPEASAPVSEWAETYMELAVAINEKYHAQYPTDVRTFDMFRETMTFYHMAKFVEAVEQCKEILKTPTVLKVDWEKHYTISRAGGTPPVG